MKSIFLRLYEAQDIASETEKAVIGYLLKNPEDVMNLNVRELADKTFSSPSTIIRMCQRVGFEGYKDFRQTMIYEIASKNNKRDNEIEDVSQYDSISEIIKKVTYKNIASLEETMNLVDDETLEKCVEIIDNAKNICLYGIGASLCVARDAYLKFLRLNKQCTINDDLHSQLLQAKNMNSNDVGIVISYSGYTVEMIECMRIMKENNVPLIAITRNTPSIVAKLGDYVLYIPSTEPTFRSAAMVSRMAQLNIIDLLFTALMNREYEKSLKVIRNNSIEKS
ncbi:MULTISPECIES: MurR/RpiR family transcriptional regulator [Clostridium]|uniref:Transcriptional regulator, RpiR family n=3 Tax=Clostridium cadaveris TaxID=1529 RepID=A0A1I2Q6R0_9CLOT|nr:MurR/RpiR family transcriptional regulator [Clostridium cadaveris]MDU4953019.1 MurR/RpiR family transcriptional regulator [Clostridium sp.]MDM8313061.1 MurR/RpiR family transcriptional regulator [Clostridium cadaveris]NME65786.1 MurR/RpiR family transcriptional regulator [Clostridium cadaveris]UFH65041.1 MurR/RpiR family transcriptional regulator [Clostridium cadaveris]SFG24044.1 transcriptional regulator, RpiR family [Clostridium cadaveris]